MVNIYHRLSLKTTEQTLAAAQTANYNEMDNTATHSMSGTSYQSCFEVTITKILLCSSGIRVLYATEVYNIIITNKKSNMNSNGCSFHT